MRTYDDSFSGAKIYPGRGKLFIRGDSKIFRFQNGKSESLALQRKNPRRIAWTVLCRQKRRKGIAAVGEAKRKRRAVKAGTRGVGGMTHELIVERRTQKPTARTAERKTEIEKAKADRRAKAAEAKKNKPQGGATGAKISKNQAKGSAPKPAATSR